MFWLSLARRNLNDFILITCVLNNWSEHLWTLLFWRKLSEGNSKFVIFEFDVTYFPLNSIFASTIFGHLKRTILNWFDHRLNSERSISKLPHSKKNSKSTKHWIPAANIKHIERKQYVGVLSRNSSLEFVHNQRTIGDILNQFSFVQDMSIVFKGKLH